MTIVIAGSTGLVGSAITRALIGRGQSVIGINRKVVDLLDRKATFEFMNAAKPDLVIDAAAIVGGIGANNNFPVDFLSKNIQMQSNLMDAAHAANVERFVFLGSSCIYPRDCPQPIREEYLMTAPLEETNSAYAIAKIAGIEMVKSVRKQYGLNWISLMPTNLYGAGDNFNLSDSHVLPAMIRKIVEAKRSGISSVTFWGTGSPLREFLHADDLASAVVLSSEKYDSSSHLNVGTGQDLSILKLASLISEIEEFTKELFLNDVEPAIQIFDSKQIKLLRKQKKN